MAPASAELERDGFPQFLEARLGDIHMVFHDARAQYGHHFELHREREALTAFWDELRTEVFDYIEIFYDRQRRHRSLGMLSPAQFETITHPHRLQELQTA